MSKFEVLILGSSSALPAFGRHPASQLINILENYLLIDCGEGTQSRLVQYGQKLHKIQHIFISHLHGDHYFGLPGLLTSFNLLGRKEPLSLYCPPGLEDLICDIVRLGQGEMRYSITWHTLNHTGNKRILDTPGFEVYAFSLKHRIPTFGFLMAEKTRLRNMKTDMLADLKPYPELIRSIKKGENVTSPSGQVFLAVDYSHEPHTPRQYAYVSDTLYSEDIIPFLRGIDLLYHESTYMEDLVEKASENFHSTARQAAQIAGKAGVKKLLLGHFSSRYKALDQLLKEAVSIFPNSSLALEGENFSV